MENKPQSNEQPLQGATREEVQKWVAQALQEQADAAFLQREKRLDEKERDMQQREKLCLCAELLKNAGLPEELAPTLAGVPDEKLHEAVEKWDECFRACVQRAVEERLQGSTPGQGLLKDVQSLPDADYYAQVYPHLV